MIYSVNNDNRIISSSVCLKDSGRQDNFIGVIPKCQTEPRIFTERRVGTDGRK